MSNLVHNERLKYAASVLNNLAVTSFAAGVVLPIFAPSTQVDGRLSLALGIVLGLMCLFASYHTLGGLKEN
jgi:hypothetical protein